MVATACSSDNTPSTAMNVASNDTTIMLGGRFSIQVQGVEAFRASSGLEVDNSGVVWALALGSHFVTLYGQGKIDTLHVGVVPFGRALVSVYGSWLSTEKVLAFENLDGSHRQILVGMPGTPYAWANDGDHFVFIGPSAETDYEHLAPQLMYGDLSDHSDTLVGPGQFASIADPSISADRKTIYFTGGDSLDNTALYRIGTDGSGLALFAPNLPGLSHASAAHHSDRLVVTTADSDIAVLDAATGTLSSWRYPATYGAWAPSDTLIAAQSSIGAEPVVFLLNPATGAAVDTIRNWYFGSWSPDDQWIMGAGYVNVRTGMVVPVTPPAPDIVWQP